jgi:hypothetical protein
MSGKVRPTYDVRELAAALGSLGGKARAKKLSAKRLREIAMMGVAARKRTRKIQTVN